MKRTLLRGFARTIPVGVAGITTLENNVPNIVAEQNTQQSNEKLIRDTKFILQSPEYPRATQTVYLTHLILRDTPVAQNDIRRAVLNPKTRTQRLDERAIPRPCTLPIPSRSVVTLTTTTKVTPTTQPVETNVTISQPLIVDNGLEEENAPSQSSNPESGNEIAEFQGSITESIAPMHSDSNADL